MLIDNFKQHFESCVLNTKNAWKSAQNQINSLSTSRNELMKIFRGFRVFEYALWQKTKTGNAGSQSFLNSKHPLPTVAITRKLLKTINFLPKHDSGFNNQKSRFKAIIVNAH